MQERAANQDRKAFKVLPRAHIGYLVGYEASNIYRIWVPVLKRVIRTRNVRFDEDIVYSPERERAEGPPLATAEEMALNIEIDEDIQDAEDLYLNFPFEVMSPVSAIVAKTIIPCVLRYISLRSANRELGGARGATGRQIESVNSRASRSLLLGSGGCVTNDHVQRSRAHL